MGLLAAIPVVAIIIAWHPGPYNEPLTEALIPSSIAGSIAVVVALVYWVVKVRPRFSGDDAQPVRELVDAINARLTNSAMLEAVCLEIRDLTTELGLSVDCDWQSRAERELVALGDRMAFSPLEVSCVLDRHFDALRNQRDVLRSTLQAACAELQRFADGMHSSCIGRDASSWEAMIGTWNRASIAIDVGRSRLEAIASAGHAAALLQPNSVREIVS